MKRNLMAILFVFSFLGSIAFAETAESILEKTITALGGRNAMQEIKTLKMTGKMAVQGMDIDFTYYFKSPDKTKMDLSVMGQNMVTVFDGESGWAINPMAGPDPVDMSKEQIEKAKLQMGGINSPLTMGTKMDYIGKEDIDNVSYNKLKFKMNDGKEAIYFINVKTSIPFKMSTTMDEKQNVDLIFSDYKKVNNFLMCFSYVTNINGAQQMKLTYDKAEANVDIDDSIFKKPAK